MKRIIRNIFYFTSIVIISTCLSSCNEFLGIMPAGSKIPTTLSDFEALLRDEYTCQRADITQAVVLLNDKFETASNLNYYKLRDINYNWKEGENRIPHNTDEGTYYNTYAAISTYNLILQSAQNMTECTEKERNVLIAQARLLRAHCYFLLANYYAETYDKATAETKLSVPLITSADMGAAYKQVTIADLYSFILEDINAAITNLPERAQTAIHPNLGAGYALLARVYLQMEEYNLALEAADKALNQNNRLYDWVKYYNDNKFQIDNPISYVSTTSPMGYDYVENYYFRHGSSSYSSSENSITIDRANLYENNDLKFKARWKLKTVGADTYYVSTLRGVFNHGGLTTTEVYLIRAECLARAGKLSEAMADINAIRITRILPDKYIPLSASTTEQAIKYIKQIKNNELIFSITPFADTRRLNKDPKYLTTLTKQVNGETRILAPNSYLYTMPFPVGAIENTGNGSLVQNVAQ